MKPSELKIICVTDIKTDEVFEMTLTEWNNGQVFVSEAIERIRAEWKPSYDEIDFTKIVLDYQGVFNTKLTIEKIQPNYALLESIVGPLD